jgi:hypothetical protein
MKTEEPMQRKIAPRIPSWVFLGDMPCAKGLFPIRLPKRSPPLSACHERQNVIAMYLGLKMKNPEFVCLCCLLENVKDIAERGNETDVELPENFEQEAHTCHNHGLPDEAVLFHHC